MNRITTEELSGTWLKWSLLFTAYTCLSNLSILFLSWSPLTFLNDIPQFCQFGELVEVHCRTTSKSTDLTFSPRGKMVVLCYFLSGWFHIFEKLENAALCPYLQCLLDCREWCFFLWSMVALLGLSDLCFLCVCLPFRLPRWLRWTMSGRYSLSGISMFDQVHVMTVIQGQKWPKYQNSLFILM